MHNDTFMAVHVPQPKVCLCGCVLHGASHGNDTGVLAQRPESELARSVCCRAVPPVRVWGSLSKLLSPSYSRCSTLALSETELQLQLQFYVHATCQVDPS